MVRLKYFMLIFLLITPSFNIARAQCPASIYNYYNFDEGLIGSGSTGARVNLTDVIWSAGILKNSLLFNGLNSKGTLNDNYFNWASDQDFSIEFWFNLKTSKASNMVLIGRDDPVKQLQWWIGIESSGLKPVFYMRDNTGLFSSVTSGSAIVLNTWNHVAVVRDNATNNNLLYINGQLAGSSQVDYTGDFSSAEPVTFGCMNNNGTYSNFSNAEIDEFVIHNNAISAADVLAHYTDQISSTPICEVQNNALKILPLGNSITYDNRADDLRPIGEKAGYRIFLYNKLKAAGYNFDFIGSEVAGQDLFADPENGGIPGISKEQLVTLLQTGFNQRTSKYITNGPYLDFFSPDVILLHIGTNGVSTDVTAINQILTIIEAHRVQTGKNIKLIFAKIINRVVYDAITNQYNNNLEDAVNAQNSPHNYIVDMENGAGLDYSLDMNDNLHPNDSGYEKMASLWFSVLSGILDAPSGTFVKAPTNLASLAQENSITLTWIDNSTNESGFRIERKTESGSFEQIAEVDPNIVSYNDVTVQPITKYTYRIYAHNPENSSTYSNESIIQSAEGYILNLSTGKPVMQSSTAFSRGPGLAIDNNTDGIYSNGSIAMTQNELNAYWQIDLQNNYTIHKIEIWNRTDACCINKLNNFYVFVSDIPFTSVNPNTTLAQEGIWSVFSAAYPNPSASFNVNRSGQYVRVQLANQGSLSLAEVKIYGFTPSTTLPAAPSTLSAQSLSANSISLSWTDNSNNETGFKIERKTGTGAFEEIAVVTANTSTYSNTGLQPSTSYTYRVFAYSAAGNSAFSNESVVQTLPAAPSGLAAQAQTATSVELTWTDNSTGETGFKIERKTGTGVFEEVAVVTANTSTYSNTGLQPSTSYTYRVFAYSATGNSAFSNESEVQTLPAAPSGLTAQAQSATSVKLTWTDNSADETGFKIERKTGTGVFEEIAVVTANTSTYTHTGLQPSTSYTYRVFAYSTAGNSAFSNESVVQTLPAAPSGLTAQAQTATSVSLTWTDNSTGETGVKIERKTGTGEFEVIAVFKANTSTS
jgi:lysophospholipase L1-like esterase